MASLTRFRLPPLRPLVRPLCKPALPQLPAARRFIHPAARPRLPYLLRPALHLAPRPRPTLVAPPARRLISARTKAYLYRESLTAARVIVYGYTALLLTGSILLISALVSAESTHPTPRALPLSARAGIALARAIAAWTDNHAAATRVLRNTVAELEAAPNTADPDWTAGYAGALQALAELEELAGEHAVARETWAKVLRVAPDAKSAVAAALRVASIAEFCNDPGAAQAALESAVAAAGGGGAGAVGLLLRAQTQLGVLHARRGSTEEALGLFTKVLAARRRAGPPADPLGVGAAEAAGDPCAEAVTMTYIGEVVFAMGQRRQGIAWSREAFERAVELAEVRGRCRECAIVAGRNLSAMAVMMREEGVKGEGKGGGWGSLFGKKGEVELEESPEKWEEAVRNLERIRATKTL